MGKHTLRHQAESQMIDMLKQEGKRIVEECLNEKEYQHRTYNLHDSYGTAIYYYGKKVWSYTPAPVATKEKFWKGEIVTGAQEIHNFFNTYQSSPKMIELVVAAAMPYSQALEYQGSGQLRRYKVVSMSYDKLREVMMRTGGNVETILESKKES